MKETCMEKYLNKLEYNLIIENRLENIRLTSLRDTLLPKLISGEIDVSSIDL